MCSTGRNVGSCCSAFRSCPRDSFRLLSREVRVSMYLLQSVIKIPLLENIHENLHLCETSNLSCLIFLCPVCFFFCVRTVCNWLCEAECSGEIDPLLTYFTGQFP